MDRRIQAAPAGQASAVPATSLLARTTASSGLPVGPSSAHNSHARAYLDAIAPSTRRAAVVLQRTASTLGTADYKPQKPSSLASGASVTGSDSDDDDDDTVDVAALDGHSERRREGSYAGVGSEAQRGVADLDDMAGKLSSIESADSAGTVPSNGSDQIASILALLDDMTMDEEVKIDTTRNRLGAWLEDIEGVKPSPFRLDSTVLELMHRHREDVNPTGASFPSSPLRRPGSARSFSSQNAHRPWTPTKPPFSGSTMTSTAGSTTLASVLSAASASGPSATSLASPAEITTSSPTSLTSSIPPTFATTPFLSSGLSTPSRSASPAAVAANDPGVIGSGSPRGSPRFWNKVPGSLSFPSAHRDSIDSISAQAGSPWGGFQFASGPNTPSSLSAASGFAASASPFWSAQSSLSPATAAATLTSSTSATKVPSSTAGSRPASPSPFNSPRLNVAAAAFKPRTASNSSQTPLTSSGRPSLLEVSSRRSSGQAILHKNHPVGDDDDDEFSPFGTGKANSNHPSSSAGGLQGSSAGSYFGDDAVSGEELAGVAGIGADDEEAEAGGMAPFDVLYSILAGAKGTAATQWSPEQIEEALASHNWDVESTLTFIFENGGRPVQSSGRKHGPIPAGPSRLAGPTSGPPTGPAAWSARGGVAVMSRDAFSSFRGGKTSEWANAQGRGRGVGAPSVRAATAASGLNAAGVSAGIDSDTQSPAVSPPGSHGTAPFISNSAGAGPGRVCRYFLSGDCRRADCRFSHDLSKALCKFWLRGQCLNDPCPFLHDQDVVQALANGMSTVMPSADPPHNNATTPATTSNPSNNGPAAAGGSSGGGSDDFPELPPSGPKAERAKFRQSTGPPAGAPTGPAATDPSRSRWASALQRNAAAGHPLLALQQGGGDIGLHNVHARNAPVSRLTATRPPLGPRTASSASMNATKMTARITLRAPSLLPTLNVGKLAASSYEKHRSSVAPLIEQRNRCLAKASEAFRAGDNAVARKWSSEGQALNVKIAERSPSIARDIVRERHRDLQERLQAPSGADGGGWGSSGNASDEPGARGLRGSSVGNGLGLCLGVARKDALPPQCAQLTLEERTECFLDAHGLHAGEAIDVIEEFLLALEQREGSHTMRGLVYLAVGSSRHTSTSTDRRRVKLAGAVKGFLGSWGYPFAEHDGVLAVDHLTHY
ncbi:unnamed protein product [Parajaminaea phylloscopi]